MRLNFTIWLAYSFFFTSFFLAEAQASDQSPVVVKFLPQIHGSRGQDMDEETAHSQFAIFKELIQHPDAVVFNESQTEDMLYDVEFRSLGAIFADGNKGYLKDIFKNIDSIGVYEDLNDNQKILLGDLRAPKLALYLNRIASIMATDTFEEHRATVDWLYPTSFAGRPFVSRFSDEYQVKVFTRRESEALQRIQHFVRSKDYHGQHLYLIFGAEHEFEGAAAYTKDFVLKRDESCEIKLAPAPKNFNKLSYEEIVKRWADYKKLREAL